MRLAFARRFSGEHSMDSEDATLPSSASAPSTAAEGPSINPRTWGWMVSTAFHVAIIAGMARCFLPGIGDGNDAEGRGARRAAGDTIELPCEFVANESSSETEPIDSVVSVAGLDASSARPQPRASGLRRLVEAGIAQASRIPEGKSIHELDRMAERLEVMVSPTSLGEITMRLQAEFEPPPAHLAATASATREDFDSTTAHIQDAYQHPETKGYMAILIDRRGQRLEVPMGKAEGERLVRLMEWMKSHPLVEGIYRNLVTGIMDQLLARIDSHRHPAASRVIE